MTNIEDMCCRLKHQIEVFNEGLSDHEIAALVTPAGRMTIFGLGALEPDLIVIDGFDEDVNHIRIFCHISQVNLTFVSANNPFPNEPKKEIFLFDAGTA